MPFPFEVDFDEVRANTDLYVGETIASLVSDFLVMPKGPGFVDYAVFEKGYEELKRTTQAFQLLSPDTVADAVFRVPICLIILRSMLGFTPSEWAYIASQRTGTLVSQGAARSLDRRIRLAPERALVRRDEQLTTQRILALVASACEVLTEGAPAVPAEKLHRLDKADTASGLVSLRSISHLGVPYAMVLYERFLGRPFAGHRDSVSELVGDVLETAVEEILCRAGIGYRKTRRAERLGGFDQAPDFVVPDEFNPRVTIEAKLTEDDGTARDKVTRIQHLAELSLRGQPLDRPRFEVVACISGRGFAVRREDMKKLILATRGKVFTLQNLDRLIDHTSLRELRTR